MQRKRAGCGGVRHSANGDGDQLGAVGRRAWGHNGSTTDGLHHHPGAVVEQDPSLDAQHVGRKRCREAIDDGPSDRFGGRPRPRLVPVVVQLSDHVVRHRRHTPGPDAEDHVRRHSSVDDADRRCSPTRRRHPPLDLRHLTVVARVRLRHDDEIGTDDLADHLGTDPSIA